MPCAQDDGVVFSSIRVTHKEGAAAAADAENESVWLTGTPGDKIPPFTSAAWGEDGEIKVREGPKTSPKTCSLNVTSISVRSHWSVVL